MCQVDEEYNSTLEHKSLPAVSKKCMKCKEGTAVLIIRVGDAFCRSCFKEYFIHKFRAMLGKNRVIFPGEKVLLAVSGGPASSCMLAQVQEGLSRDAPKKLRFMPGIIYIDEGGVCGQNAEEREKAVVQLESIFRMTGFPYHIVPLEQVFTLPESVLEPVYSHEQPGSSYKAAVDQHIRTEVTRGHGEPAVEETQDAVGQLSLQACTYKPEHRLALEGLFSSLKTLTAKQDMLQILRHHLILHTARIYGYSKVMIGDSCTRLAIKLLTNISLGRGAALAADTAFSDSRYGDVVMVRPMRDYSSKEIGFYNRLFEVQSVFIPGLDTKTADKASIQRLTESFVVKLQADFPSTVSTVYRTSEKLHTACPPRSSTTEAAAKCLLCLCALDTKADDASAFHATLVSEQLSRGALQEKRQSDAGCCQGQKQACGDGGCCSTSRVPIATDLKSLLCYSCRLTIKDMTAVDSLPPYITSEAEKRQRRAAMKEEISEFLLEDEGADDA
ncbi:cytoplasmic tRNA 2-thiolation protein 2 [Pangasianodon hypophthalmus]|uniref:cytoplasmic tRNA 2-thiolation protein 2 n=1 Tax=Pangasianodon hypophthalmus TaxID=310915 RepID=UPI000F00DCB5|nr:cytoplasmic tRNA 2-thiolation protein 2 [Pangasianodon hypophthalmus]